MAGPAEALAPVHLPATASWRRGIFIALFMVSGFAGIIYESIWTHYLKLFLGHAAYAQALVLAIFMGGMAVGAWFVSGTSWRWHNLLRAYAVVELVIGLLGMGFHPAFEAVRSWSFDTLLPLLETPAAVQAGKWGMATLLILPQSVLLGMTFPLMAGGIVRMRPDASGESLAVLYFCNSLGAAAGILASGFLLIAWVGLPGTILTAAVINILLALCVWLLADDAGSSPAKRPAAIDAGAEARDGGELVLLCLLVAFATGAASFFYEMAWIRMLSLVLGASTHAFELMLSAFILGLSLGSLWIRRRIDTIADPIRFLGYVQVVMAVLALASLWLYAEMFSLMKLFLAAVQRSESGYQLFNLFSHAIAMLIMLPATFCAGMTLPLITKILFNTGLREKSIGRVYSLNTVGAIVAVILAIHFTIPHLGLKGTILTGAGIDMIAGLVLLYRWRRQPVSPGWPVTGAGCAAALVLTLMLLQLDPRQLASGVYRHGDDRIADDAEMVFYRDGKTASISLYDRSSGVRTLASNGKPDASIQLRPDARATVDEVTMTMLAVLPSVYHPRAGRVVNVGIGSAQTTHVMLANPGYEQVDTVEIEQAVVDAARRYGKAVERAFTDPRSHIHIDDAKTFIANRKLRYDVVVSEPPNPWVSGVASLFSEEFYANVRGWLTEDGILVQWLHLYEFDLDLAFSVLKAISNQFPDYRIYNTSSVDIVIVATAAGSLPAPDYAFPFQAGYRQQLERVHLRSPQDLRLRAIAGRDVLDPLVSASGVPANSDYFPYVDLHAARARFLNRNAMGLSALPMRGLPYLQMLGKQPVAHGPGARITRDPYFNRSQLAWRAGLVADYLLEAGAAMPPELPVDLQRSLAFLHPRGAQCVAAVSEEVLFRSYREFSEAVNPYLPVRQLAAVWSGIVDRHPCANARSEELQAWLALFRATALRDAIGMRSAAGALLGGARRLGRGAAMQGYLLHAVALAAIAQGDDRAAARALRQLPRSQQNTLETKLLVAHLRN